jgi:hypothetical protein
VNCTIEPDHRYGHRTNQTLDNSIYNSIYNAVFIFIPHLHPILPAQKTSRQSSRNDAPRLPFFPSQPGGPGSRLSLPTRRRARLPQQGEAGAAAPRQKPPRRTRRLHHVGNARLNHSKWQCTNLKSSAPATLAVMSCSRYWGMGKAQASCGEPQLRGKSEPLSAEGLRLAGSVPGSRLASRVSYADGFNVQALCCLVGGQLN